MLNHKSILITGGTGTLGQALVRRILECWPQVDRVIIFSRDEQKQFQMAQSYNQIQKKQISCHIQIL